MFGTRFIDGVWRIVPICRHCQEPVLPAGGRWAYRACADGSPVNNRVSFLHAECEFEYASHQAVTSGPLTELSPLLDAEAVSSR